jgi:cell division protein FtsI (penicillin-binding protein 3)
MNRKNELLARVYVVMMLFVFFSLWVVVRAVDINVVEGEKWRSKLKQNIKWKEVAGDRGSIFADDGSLLAASQPFFEIRFDLLTPDEKTFNEGVDSLAYYLSTELRPDKSPVGWSKELRKVRKAGQNRSKQGARYYLIASNVDYNELLRIRQFPIFKKGRFRGGLIEVQHSKRVKPFHEMASRTIGMDRENAEKIGLEGYFDDVLKGQSAKRLYKRLPSKTWIPVYEQENTLLNKGADLITTLNIGIQDVVHQEVMKKLIQTRAEAGVAIVMEVETGAVKAMTSLSKGERGAYEEYFNYAVGWKGKYNPGSTFKLATVLAMLEDGYVTPQTKVDLERGVKYFGKDRMSDSEPHNYREVDLEKAFVISSNVGVAKLANKYYNRTLATRKQYVRRLKSFGLSQKTGIEIVGESEPVIKDPELDKNEWSGITIPWMAHGYEVEFNPLQLLTFYNAIANDGYRVEPFLAKELVKEGEVIPLRVDKEIKKRIANEYSVRKMQDMLRKVVLEGTARKLKNLSVNVAGKTGTSRINYADTEAEEKIYNASFAGYFPAEDPKYSCIVVMYGVKGAGNIYGSQSAAPVFGSIAEKVMRFEAQKHPQEMDEMAYAKASLPSSVKGYNSDVQKVLEYANVPVAKEVDKSWIEMENKHGRIEMGDLKISRKTVPDVRGMGLRDAVYILENLGMSVKIKGVGRVQKQSLTPHSRNTHGEIILYLD